MHKTKPDKIRESLSWSGDDWVLWSVGGLTCSLLLGFVFLPIMPFLQVDAKLLPIWAGGGDPGKQGHPHPLSQALSRAQPCPRMGSTQGFTSILKCNFVSSHFTDEKRSSLERLWLCKLSVELVLDPGPQRGGSVMWLQPTCWDGPVLADTSILCRSSHRFQESEDFLWFC